MSRPSGAGRAGAAVIRPSPASTTTSTARPLNYNCSINRGRLITSLDYLAGLVDHWPGICFGSAVEYLGCWRLGIRALLAPGAVLIASAGRMPPPLLGTQEP